MAAEEEALTRDLSWLPKVCSCCSDCCTEAWSPRHACNSEAIREAKAEIKQEPGKDSPLHVNNKVEIIFYYLGL